MAKGILVTLGLWFAAMPAFALSGFGSKPVHSAPDGQTWGVVIGVGDYQDPNIKDLPNAVRDAKTMYKALTENPEGISKENAVLMVDGALQQANVPTCENILSALEKWAQRHRREDTAIIYFAGHGKEEGGRLYLAPLDARADGIESTCVPYARFMETLDASRASRSVVILDACHAGTGRDGGRMTAGMEREIKGGRRGPKEDVTPSSCSEKKVSKERIILASCRKNEVSIEYDQHGAFTWFLLEGLEGGADGNGNGDGKTSASELGNYTCNRVSEWGARYGKQQHPILIIPRLSRDIILSRVVFSPDLDEPEMIEIPAGAFWMGSSDAQLAAAKELIEQYSDEDTAEAILTYLKVSEEPRREVAIGPFLLGKYPVTNREYKRFTGATGHRAPRGAQRSEYEVWMGNTYPAGLGDHPVVNVSYTDAQAYCAWLSRETGKHYRLPTEREWEYAAKGGEDVVFPWGDHWDSERCNGGRCVHGEFEPDKRADGYLTTAPVRTFQPNRFGLYQMAGNVKEWCADWFRLYEGKSDERMRCLRGGGWRSPPDHQRPASRDAEPSGCRRPDIGFRVACDSDWDR